MMDLTKHKNYRNKKITQSARGEDCQVNLPGCTYNSEETVWAHSDYLEDGKGKSIKAHDFCGTYACAYCHSQIGGDWVYTDMTKEEIRDWFHRGMKKSLYILFNKGVIK